MLSYTQIVGLSIYKLIPRRQQLRFMLALFVSFVTRRPFSPGLICQVIPDSLRASARIYLVTGPDGNFP